MEAGFDQTTWFIVLGSLVFFVAYALGSVKGVRRGARQKAEEISCLVNMVLTSWRDHAIKYEIYGHPLRVEFDSQIRAEGAVVVLGVGFTEERYRLVTGRQRSVRPELRTRVDYTFELIPHEEEQPVND